MSFQSLKVCFTACLFFYTTGTIFISHPSNGAILTSTTKKRMKITVDCRLYMSRPRDLSDTMRSSKWNHLYVILNNFIHDMTGFFSEIKGR